MPFAAPWKPSARGHASPRRSRAGFGSTCAEAARLLDARRRCSPSRTPRRRSCRPGERTGAGSQAGPRIGKVVQDADRVDEIKPPPASAVRNGGRSRSPWITCTFGCEDRLVRLRLHRITGDPVRPPPRAEPRREMSVASRSAACIQYALAAEELIVDRVQPGEKLGLEFRMLLRKMLPLPAESRCGLALPIDQIRRHRVGDPPHGSTSVDRTRRITSSPSSTVSRPSALSSRSGSPESGHARSATMSVFTPEIRRGWALCANLGLRCATVRSNGGARAGT